MQITTERGDPLFAHKTRLKHVSLVKSKNSILEEDANHDRSVRPVVCSQPVGSSSTFNEVDIDFKMSGLPHSVVNQAENSRVRELVKRMENHLHRQDLQADGQGDGVPKAGLQQAAADSRGSRNCVCANIFDLGVAHIGEKG